ncbi:hypothetical protein D3C87_1856060 [compost metagenome]
MGGVARTVMHPGNLQHDQPDAAFGTRPVIGDQLLVDQVVGRHRSVVAAGHDAVLETLATDLQRFEQVRERWGGSRHGAILQASRSWKNRGFGVVIISL